MHILVIGEKALTISEVDQVSGGSVSKAMVTAGTTVGSAHIGAFLGGAQLGAMFGSAAGPIGAVLGAIVGGGASYVYLQTKN